MLKVVAHLRDGGLVKGYADMGAAPSAGALTREDPATPPSVIEVRPAESKKPVSVPLDSLKALFYVKDLEGNSEYKEVKFFQGHPPIEGLWVRLTFYDNETYEGVVRNSLDFLNGSGFFLKPPDPHSNNEVVYVLKISLVAFEVLGVRSKY